MALNQITSSIYSTLTPKFYKSKSLKHPNTSLKFITRPLKFTLFSSSSHQNHSTIKPFNSIFDISFPSPMPSPTPSSLQGPSTAPTLAQIKPFVQSEWKPILKGWLCSVISVYCVSKIVPKVGNFSSVLGKMGEKSVVLKEGIVLGVLVLVRLVACYWQQAFLWEAALGCGCKIRMYVYEKVLKRDLEFFEGGGGVAAGDIAYRITGEAMDVADTVYALLNTIIPSALQLTAMVNQMLVVSPVLSLISALVIPCISLVNVYFGERLRKISRKAQYSMAKISAYLNEVLPSMLFVKASNAEVCESSRFKRLALSDLSEHLGKKKMKALIPQIIQAIAVGVLLVLFVVSLAVSNGVFDGSGMVSFVTALSLVIEPVMDVGKAYNELKQGEPAIERLFGLTTFNPQVVEKSDATNLKSVTGDVKFCNVSFSYSDNMPLVLNKLNLHIKAGETVALVGPSGGGKTTLSKLLLRLYDPLCGCVFIDNNDIRSIRMESLRQHVGLVSQDIILFSGTVAENIGYRDLLTGIDIKKVEHAAKTANAEEFIKKLSKGYDTNVGPRGSIFSGGQKQRLAIARAIYQNSSILIMDEATSALDSKSELLVREAVEHLMEDHTVLVIAHRMDTIQMADRVLRLENGKLEEVSPITLMEQDNHFDSLLSNEVALL